MSYQKRLLISVAVVVFIIYTIKKFMQREEFGPLYIHKMRYMPSPSEFVQDDTCLCYSSKEGKKYDFCYRLPQNRTVVGKQFSCEHAEKLRDLGLIDNSLALNPETDDMPEPAFVMALSDNHVGEARAQIWYFRFRFPTKKLYIYDLGMGKLAREEFKRVCHVELRKFQFNKYPHYVKKLNQYRWKPLIIAEMLKEFGAVWWFDTSVNFLTRNLSTVENMIACRFRSHSSYNKVNCSKASFLLHESVGHGVFAVITPGMYDYIPTDKARLATADAPMFGALLSFAVRTAEAFEVLKWHVLCALENECMAPPGSKLSCSFNEDRFKYYANCHRYDQSSINLILFNQYNYTYTRYTTGTQDYFEVKRGQAFGDFIGIPCK